MRSGRHGGRPLQETTLSHRPPVCLLVTLLLLMLVPTGSDPHAAASRLESLTTLFDLKLGIVRDTNGDGLADTVAARVIVPADPTADDLEAAANIAARLSFETTAMTLPLVVRDDQVASPEAILLPILVGRENR